jgi:hypothetical protein
MKLLAIPIGIILIIASPFVLWQAESQSRASDFAAARPVELASQEKGYIKLNGKPEYKDNSLACPAKSKDAKESCLLVEKQTYTYTLSEKEKCSPPKENEKVLKTLGEKCDEDNDCDQCYLVEVREWKSADSGTEFTEFTLGDYAVNSTSKSIIIGKKDFTEYIANPTIQDANNNAIERDPKTNPLPGDTKIEYHYLLKDQDLIVAGVADNQTITAGDMTFVISALNDTATLEELASQDTAAQWGLRILSLVMVIFAFSMIANAITAIPMFFVSKVPFFGQRVSKAVNGVVGVIAAAIGLLFWGLIFLVILLIKNILALVLSFVLIGGLIGGGYVLIKKLR